MATIKSYTDIEQSKKLAEILPLESADMRYSQLGDMHPWVWTNTLIEKDAIPCWSLAALLGILPFVDFTMLQLIDTPETLYKCMYNDNLKSHAYDNPVDACVAMIEKLHELKML